MRNPSRQDSEEIYVRARIFRPAESAKFLFMNSHESWYSDSPQLSVKHEGSSQDWSACIDNYMEEFRLHRWHMLSITPIDKFSVSMIKKLWKVQCSVHELKQKNFRMLSSQSMTDIFLIWTRLWSSFHQRRKVFHLPNCIYVFLSINSL